MSGFPINLDLSEYFDDLRKYSSVFVNVSKCKDVGDVENHVKSVFGLEDNICLVFKKFLIPKSEDIQILRQYDIFRVQKCNFYDLQIHKTKKPNSNSSCDQKALNLTQSEKTIDLSCRPKQRLKANVCPSPGVSGTSTLHVGDKKCNYSPIVSPECAISLNGNHHVPKDKPKHKKKRYLRSDESDDDAGNILDMSVKNSKKKKHSNCFSTDDGSILSEDVNDVYHRDTKDLHKKPKKRKKYSEELDDTSLDLTSTCWASLVSETVSSKDQNSKKKAKKVKEDCLNGSSSTDTNKTAEKLELENKMDCDNNCSVDVEGSFKKKHKQSKKYVESKSLHDTLENQYYSSSPLCTSRIQSLKKSSIDKISNDNKCEENSNSDRSFEDQKKKLSREVDKLISKIHNNSTDTNIQNCGDDKKVLISNEQHISDIRLQENYKESGTTENKTQESCIDSDSTIAMRKRRRKHNKKKKKKEKLCLYMLAVGPTVNQLATQPTVAKPSPSSEISKHVYFTEDDFVEDMTIPSTPASTSTSQTVPDPSMPHNNNAEVAISEEQSSSKPETWQDKLLRLATSSSKPVVFHRHMDVAAIKKPVLPPTQEYSTPVLNAIQTDSNADRPVQVNPVAEDFQRCNGEVKSDNNEDRSSCSETVNGGSSRKGVPDNCKPLPIPNDLQNINLTDYPIIDKVVAEDLILFKVLKLNENCEPGVSKPILARVHGISNLPDRISLQIMEGCEECSHCVLTEEPGEGFTVEMRWSDIKEPRLFYP